MIRALLDSQRDVVAIIDNVGEQDHVVRIAVRVVCPRCGDICADVREFGLGFVGDAREVVVAADAMPLGAALLVQRFDSGVVSATRAYEDRKASGSEVAAQAWLLLERGDAIPREVPTRCAGCNADRAVNIASVRTALAKSRHYDTVETIRAERSP